MSEKIIRDPVHDVIAFRLNQPADRLLFDLVNAVEFQRLRQVRQLGMASLAYPGADHSRYSHSLGVMETARKMLAQLGEEFPLDAQDRMLAVVAALLHDLGHGPFSHVFERVSGVDHERLTHRVILDPDSDVHRVLRDHDRAMPEMIAGLLDRASSGKGANAGAGEARGLKRTFLCDIISSQLDADRFDYLLRDNLMTGSRYGGYDLEWLLHALTIDQSCDRLAVHAKGISAVEAYLQARFNMYRNVYFHKVVRSAEGMVKLALQRAKRLAVQGRLDWPRPGDGLYKALLGQQMTMGQFNELDDISILHCFKQWAHAADGVLAALCRGLLHRRVFKTIDLTHLTDPLQARKAMTAAERMIAAGGAEPAYEMFIDQPSGAGYVSDETGECGGENEILVRQPGGRVAPLGSISPLGQALNRQLMFRRLHVSPQWRDRVEAAVKDAT